MSTNVETRMHELESLTRSYARYSRSAGGVGSVLGGLLCLIAYAGAPLLPMTALTRLLLMAIPAVWLLAKGWMVRSYYQRFGHVEEQESVLELRMHRLYVAVTLLVAMAITITAGMAASARGWSLPTGGVGYLALVWLLVLAAWRWLRTPLDFIIGVFLFCQAALVSTGRFYPLIGTAHTQEAALMSLLALMFPLLALVMIAVGIAEHRQFRGLRLRLEQLRVAPAGEA